MSDNKKSIIFLKSAVALPVNGADISMFERLSILNSIHHWNCRVLCFAPKKNQKAIIEILKKLGVVSEVSDGILRYKIRGVPVMAYLEDRIEIEPLADFESFCRIVSEILTDSLIVCNLRDFAATYFCHKNRQIPHVFFMTENEYPRPAFLTSIENGDLVNACYRNADNVIVATKFLQNSLESSWGIKARKFENVVDIKRYSVQKENEAQYISMLHPYKHKGVDIFFEIAKNLPDRKFLLLGGTGQEYRERKAWLSSLPNLQLLPFQPETAAIYAKSRIVLVPSLWEEAFSRVVIESFASATPVIAFDRGGIAEAGRDAAIYIEYPEDPNTLLNVDKWIDAIKQLDDKNRYAERLNIINARVDSYSRDLEQSISEMSQWFQNLSQTFSK